MERDNVVAACDVGFEHPAQVYLIHLTAGDVFVNAAHAGDVLLLRQARCPSIFRYPGPGADFGLRWRDRPLGEADQDGRPGVWQDDAPTTSGVEGAQIRCHLGGVPRPQASEVGDSSASHGLILP